MSYFVDTIMQPALIFFAFKVDKKASINLDSLTPLTYEMEASWPAN